MLKETWKNCQSNRHKRQQRRNEKKPQRTRQKAAGALQKGY